MALTLIFEPNPGGHRFQAVANVARVALAEGPVRVITSRGAATTDEYAAHLNDVGVELVESFDGPTPETSAFVSSLREQLADSDVSRVVVMEADDVLKTWWLRSWWPLIRRRPRPAVVFFLTRWSARLNSAGREDLYYWKIRIAKILLVLLSRAVGTLDYVSGFASRDERSPGWIVKSARDPAQCSAHSRDRAQLRRKMGLPDDRRLVGIFGGINARKNPALALEAVLRCDPSVGLLLAGPMSEEARTWWSNLSASDQTRVVVRDEFLSNDELDEYVAAVDVVLLLMKLEGPSGIMGKALAADVPVVTAGSKTRARELAAIHRGVATSLTAEALADAISRVIEDPPQAPETDLTMPTGESFGASVLGLPDADPALVPPPREPNRVARVRRSIVNRLRQRAVTAYLRPSGNAGLIRLGSPYGGWWIPETAIRPGAVAYLGGAGEDITLDLALHERGCIVRTIDPTPRAIKHVAEVAPSSERFQFLPVGLWDVEDTIEFFSPAYPQFVSHSAVNLYNTEPSFRAAVKPLHEIMRDVGDDRVDILKLDIEGAEHRTLEAMVAHGPLPAVVCVEFDQPQPLRQIIDRVRKLRAAGYQLRKVEGWNYTFTR